MSSFKFITASLAAVLLSLTCKLANAAEMTISGTPPTTAIVGHQYRFMPEVKNAADPSQLQFNYYNLPSFSKHYRGSGLIMGTPTTPGVFTNVQIGAWDGSRYVLLPPFTITVLAASSAGTGNSTALGIYGTPAASATVGQYYTFRPTVVAAPTSTSNGADAASGLTFAVANKPDWAQFNMSTGVLSGTPTSGSTAVNANVIISVSNGKTVAALPAFTIDVAQPASASVTSGIAYLTWTKPVTNADGSLLTNLSGYLIRYGTSAASLTKQVQILANATEAQIENLAPGNWYFEIASLNSANVQSPFSTVISSMIK